MQKKSIKFKKSILSLIILAIFLAPISAGIRINKIKAQTPKTTMSIEKDKITDISAFFKLKINNTVSDYQDNGVTVILYDKYFDAVKNSKPNDVKIIKKEIVTIKKNTPSQTISLSFDNLTKQTSYFLSVNLYEGNISTSIITRTTEFILKNVTGTLTEFTTSSSPTSNDGIITSNTTNSGNPNIDITINNKSGDVIENSDNFGCSLNPLSPNLGGCILQIFYYLWQASAWVATLAGGFLDFFIYYSTNSASYDNMFVKQAWAAVRDIANIFFIIALLFIAVKTVLGLNVSDNKKLVGTVVVIALVINFSLFTSQLVIDGSNILAKVFYNNISSVDEKGNKTEDTNSGGQKSISVGLVQKFNPQNIVMDAYDYGNGLGIGYVIFIIILLMAITLYTAYIFFSVALLFVARVVSLWISMIFSPMAFASYTVPFDIPGFGHKEWWSDLLKNAFLAPLFIFMLYIIVLFAGFLTEIAKYTSDPNLTTAQNTMQRLMSIIIPFIILMVLLRKSKELAVKYSGELGAAINKFGGTIAGIAGGVVGGAVIGTVAAAGQATLGHAGKKLFESKTLTEMETNTDKGLAGWGKRFVGRNLRTIGGGDDGKGGMAGSSFDARKGIVGGGLGLLSKATGLNMGGQSKFLMKESGGYEADLKRKHEKRLKRAEGLKTKEGEEAKQTLNKYEEGHQDVSMKNENALHELDLKIAGATKRKQYLKDIYDASNKNKDKNGNFIDPETEKKRQEYENASKDVKDFEKERGEIKNGLGKDKKTGLYLTDNGLQSVAVLDGEVSDAESNSKSAKTAAEQAEKNIKNAEENIKSAETNAEKIRTEANKTITEAMTLEQAIGSSLAPDDIAKREAARDTANKAREEIRNAEKAIEDAKMNLNSAKTDKTAKDTLANEAAKKEKEIKEIVKAKKEADAEDRKNGGKGTIGYSQNYYEDHLLPHQKHKVAAISRERAQGLATDIAGRNWQFWNKDARMKSAHDIRMGVKVENHGGGKGGHGGGMVGHIISDAIANKITGGGHHEETAAPNESHGASKEGGGKNAHTTEHHG